MEGDLKNDVQFKEKIIVHHRGDLECSLAEET